MEYNTSINLLTLEMCRFDAGDARRIQHFLKVHSFAKLIGNMEHLDAHMQFLTECAALVHDIGIHPAEQKYSKCDGKLQEQEGPSYARAMLTRLDFDREDIDRICYLVAHHHTYSNIDGKDYQILVEADFLVNLYEDATDARGIRSAYEKIFRTDAGKQLCRTLYSVPEKEETE